MKRKPYTPIELLRRWLRGETNRAEEQQLEAALREDPWLAEAMKGFREHPEQDHAAILEGMRAKLHRPTDRSAIPIVVRYAAAILFLVGALVLLQIWLPNQSADIATAEPDPPTQVLPAPEAEPLAKISAPISEPQADVSAPAPEPNPSKTIDSEASLARQREVIPPSEVAPAPPITTTAPAPMPPETDAVEELAKPELFALEMEQISDTTAMNESVGLAMKKRKTLDTRSRSARPPIPPTENINQFRAEQTYGAASLSTTALAQPSIGYAALQRQLVTNWSGPDTGTVAFQLQIGANGSILKYELIESPSDSLANFVITQLQQAGTWILRTPVTPVPLRYEVRFDK